MNYLNLLISVVITFLAYAIFPFCYLIINKKIFYIDDKKLKKILIINSVIVSLFFAIISFLLYPNDYKINFVFEKGKKTISRYNVFGMPKEFLLETKTNKLIIEDNEIKIDYELEGNNFSYTLQIGG